MRRLQQRGVSVVFVSHRLEEVLRVVDRIIVMRDGRRVGSMPRAEATELTLIQVMVGREVGLFPKVEAEIANQSLKFATFRAQWRGERQLHGAPGEILGLAGLIGAGRTELARLICGVDPRTSGEILIDGNEVHIHNPAEAVAQGIGWVPEDRKQHGLLLGMDVKQNTTLAILRAISNALGLRFRRGKRNRDAISRDTFDCHVRSVQDGEIPERRQPAESGSGQVAQHQAQNADHG